MITNVVGQAETATEMTESKHEYKFNKNGKESIILYVFGSSYGNFFLDKCK